MNPWPFVIAAYVAVALGIAGLALASWRAMAKAEAAAERVRRR